MNYKSIQKIIVAILIALFIIIISSNVFAGGIKPSDITGADYSGEFDLDFIDKITNLVRTIGIFIAVGAMMIIGIKYVTGSIEEKANYKKSMMPYLIGCFILFGASVLVPEIKDLFKDVGSDTESIANNVLSIIRAIGTMVSVGVLMILGIKYMIGSTDERATYKKTMLPYIVGVILIFASVNLTSMIYDMATKEGSGGNGESSNNGGSFSYTNGMQGALDFMEGKSNNKEALQAEYDSAVEKRNEAYKKDPNSDEYKYWKDYAFEIYETLRWL